MDISSILGVWNRWAPHSRTAGRIAQSVERWSNKPLVMGSIPIVPIFFLQDKTTSQRKKKTRDVLELNQRAATDCSTTELTPHTRKKDDTDEI